MEHLDINTVIVLIQALTLGGVAHIDMRIRRIAEEGDGPLRRGVKSLRRAVFSHTHDEDGKAVVSDELKESLVRPLGAKVEVAKDGV